MGCFWKFYINFLFTKKSLIILYITIYPIPRLIGNRINEIEKNVVDKFPQIAYVDIEIN